MSRLLVAATLAATLAFAQQPTALVSQVKVLPDKAPDCTSLKAIAQSVTRGCKNNDEKAVAVYNFMNLAHYHLQYPSEPGLGVLKEINVYGWSLCGGLHSEQSAIWRELGWGWRFVGWSGHTTVEAQYDDRWHYLDVFLKFYAWMPDGKGGRTIAGEDDLTKDPQTLIKDAFVLDKGRNVVYPKDNQFIIDGEKANWRAPDLLSCADTIEGTIEGLKTHRGSGSPEGWAGINHATGNYSTDVNLAPGFVLENTWDGIPDAWYWAGHKDPPRHSCGQKDLRNDPGYGQVLEPYINKPARSYANGTLTFAPVFTGDAVLKSFVSAENVKVADKALVPAEAGKPATVVVSLAAPYNFTKATGEAAGADKVTVSVDGGKTFKPAELKDFGAAIKGQTTALVKIEFKEALKSLRIEAIFQNNPGALPFLSPGRNVVAVSVADPKTLGENKLVVTYAYRLGSRTKSFEQLCDQGKEVSKQHNAKWSDTVTYARKTFAAKDLPATFEIDCPTPKGQYPVYPRMLFLRREIVSPDGTPSALPEGAVEAKAAAEAELQTLPNPFLVGTELPPPPKPRAVKTTKIPVTYVEYVSDAGGVTNRGTLKWPKTDADVGKTIMSAVVFSADLKALPAKGIAAARLVLPVLRGHEKGKTKLGVVLLKNPVEPGKPVDLKALESFAGTAVLPLQPAGVVAYEPAKAIPVDVTRGIKAVASGEAKCSGFAVRIAPDRSVDEGYIVRCEISPTEPATLEVDVYAD
jgi:hypothetical protein